MPEPVKFGGLVSRKPLGPPKSKVGLERASVFGAPAAEAEDDASDDEGATASIFQKKPMSKPKPLLSSKPPNSIHSPSSTKPSIDASRSAKQHMSLSARHSYNKNATEAQELDPSVYEYDDVYDSIHESASSAKKLKSSSADPSSSDAAAAAASSSAGPKYMSSLMAAASVRKRDRESARDAAVAREREAEGDEFADKEAFVTGAYRKQREEMQQAEEQERERERREDEKRRKEGGGMTGLYRDLLGREEERHARAIKAGEEALAQRKQKDAAAGTARSDEGTNGSSNDDRKERERSGGNPAEEDGQRGQARNGGATVNEDGQVVDKRELLSAGLNISRRQRERQEEERRRAAAMRGAGRDGNGRGHDAGGGGGGGARGAGDPRRAVRERQTRMLEEQLEEASKRAAADAEVEREALERAHKRRTTEKDVSSARERYLARKREAEAAKAGASAT